MNKTIMILSGGGPGPSPVDLPDADLVIAADSGLALAADLGMSVDLLVGDLDSVDPAELETARRAGLDIETHPIDKDATDLDLAMAAAVDREARRIVVVGAGEGRLDHLLGVATLLGSDRWSSVSIEWHTDGSTAYVVRRSIRIPAAKGDLVSLVPVNGDARVTLAGTKWRLEREALRFGTTRGISNEAVDEAVQLDVHQGVVLLIHTPAIP